MWGKLALLIICAIIVYLASDYISNSLIGLIFRDFDKLLINDPNWGWLKFALQTILFASGMLGLAFLILGKSGGTNE